MNMYICVGSQAIGALSLADRIEDWDPEQQAKLRQVGLGSSFELDDEEGHVFIALSADHYPLGVMGRRNSAGDPTALWQSSLRKLYKRRAFIVESDEGEALSRTNRHSRAQLPPT
jgi:hypothetical protein